MCLKVVTKEVCEIKGNPQTEFCRELQEATDTKKWESLVINVLTINFMSLS